MPLARRFRMEERGTTPRVELVGGVATFLTMSYIVFVNPAILSAAGVPFEAVAVATALSAAIAVVVMLALGRARAIHPLMWAIAPFFVLFFAADWLSANVC